MAEERCACCDLPIASCGKAAEERQRKEAAAERARLLNHGWIESRFEGKCQSCGTHYGIRDLVAYSRQAQGWIGACCA